jgi:hypothetical protein
MENMAMATSQMIGSIMFLLRARGVAFIGKITAKKRSSAMAAILSIETVIDTSRMKGHSLHRMLPSVPETLNSVDRLVNIEISRGTANNEPAKSDRAMLTMR